MARGYLEDDPGRPSRPARRAESVRAPSNQGYSAHYAESPVIRQDPPRASRRRSVNSRSSTLPRSEALRSPSRHSRAGNQDQKTEVQDGEDMSWLVKDTVQVKYNIAELGLGIILIWLASKCQEQVHCLYPYYKDSQKDETDYNL